MASAIAQLYDRLIERDIGAIPAAIRRFRENASPDELFRAVARFAVLAYAPAQHAKHAMLSCLAAFDLRDEAGQRYDDLLTECAIYAAQSRQPWSEPPIPDPPAIEDDQRGDLEEIREAIAAGDRLRGERWLAKRVGDPSLRDDFFRAASSDFEDLGHKLIVAAAAWRLAEIFGEQGRFATLRVAVWEWTSYRGAPFEDSEGTGATWAQLAERFVAAGGSIEEAHDLFLLDAAMGTSAEQRVRCYLSTRTNGTPASAGASEARPNPGQPPEYRLARDYGQCLKIFALTARRPELPADAIRNAALENLKRSPSFEEWSFA
jgi:hypothetical protein